jgi:polar amino acid transport system substrate-binding protein
LKEEHLKTVCRFILAALISVHAGACAANSKPDTIAVCDDENEWPPYSYWQRVNGQKSSTLTGYAVAVIDDIFKRRGVDYRIDMIPWQRCLAVTKLGEKYQMMLNLSYNAERASSFLFSRPYYATTAYYYYSRRQNKNGLPIETPADLRKYRVCGVQGYNYEGYGLNPGQVDQGARDFSALIAKLHLGRCTLFLEKNEVMTGFAAIGKNYLADPDIGKAPVPGLKPDLFYFGFSKRFKGSAQLRKLINKELRQMEASGQLAAMLQHALAPPPDTAEKKIDPK